jgi:hypothetical protein
MHTADRWKLVVQRMVWRMRGGGNLGALMKEMMASVEPSSPHWGTTEYFLCEPLRPLR